MPEPRGPDRLILSFHIPKTGGTSFAAVLESMYPKAVAYYYKPGNKLTHPLIDSRDKAQDPAVIAAVEASGAKVLHGHMQSAWFAAMGADPANWWTWVRDPVERVISAYFYMKARNDRAATLPEDKRPRDKIGARTLEEYAARKPNRNQQSRALSGAPLEVFGFVGITERFSESLTLLGLNGAPAETRNVNKARPQVPEAARALIGDMNSQDVALYEQALRLHEARLKGR